MTIQALDKAKELWNNPDELISLWDELESKTRQEGLIATFVNDEAFGTVADLGCGAGRFARVLDYTDYIGYDGSTEMIVKAKEFNPDNKFTCVDIFNFQPDEEYDTIIMIDVAHHQNEPVQAISRIMDLWKAKRYFFTILVGGIREDLYNSTVVAFPDFLDLYDHFYVTDTYIERFDDNQFAWVLLEICPQ